MTEIKGSSAELNNEVDRTAAWDKPPYRRPVGRAVSARRIRGLISGGLLPMLSDMTAFEKRIASVLGDDNGLTPENVRRYCAYLKKHLTFPVRVTGIEDFQWEEPYVIGGWDQDEYEELKKTNPSYTDKFDLLDILSSESDDLIAVIKRISDDQTFQMDLSWLRCVDRKSPDYRTLDDYSVWFVNY